MKNEILQIMKENGMSFNKSLGQNFLIDENVLDKIVEDVQPTDKILEIGAGLGILTNKLLSTTPNVTAIEFDKKLATYLQKTTSAKILHEDVLKSNLPQTVAENQINKIIANLPYYITSPIIMRILEELSPLSLRDDLSSKQSSDFEKALDCRVATQNFAPRNDVTCARLMVQLEVAQRIIAPEGSKSYGILSIICQYYADCSLLFKVPSSAFLPSPKVDSAVVELTLRTSPIVQSPKDDFFKLVKSAFAQRRKTFVNSVSNTLNIEKSLLTEALQKINRAENIRAEQLSIKEFDALTKILNIN